MDLLLYIRNNDSCYHVRQLRSLFLTKKVILRLLPKEPIVEEAMIFVVSEKCLYEVS